MGSRTAAMPRALFRRSLHEWNPHQRSGKKAHGDGHSGAIKPVSSWPSTPSAIVLIASRWTFFEAVGQKPTARATARDRIEHAQGRRAHGFRPLRGTSRHCLHAGLRIRPRTMRWADDRIGPEARLLGAYAWATMLKKTVLKLAFGTDYDVGAHQPLPRFVRPALHANAPMVGRKKNGWGARHEKISLDDCIRAYTSGSAYAAVRGRQRKAN